MDTPIARQRQPLPCRRTSRARTAGHPRAHGRPGAARHPNRYARAAPALLRAVAVHAGGLGGRRSAGPGRRCWWASPASCRPRTPRGWTSTRARSRVTRWPKAWCRARSWASWASSCTRGGATGSTAMSWRWPMGGFSMEVDQSVGNCPQYIQGREFEWVRDAGDLRRATEALALDAAARALIQRSDTLFIATRPHRRWRRRGHRQRRRVASRRPAGLREASKTTTPCSCPTSPATSSS
jgi:hypothetical protein